MQINRLKEEKHGNSYRYSGLNHRSPSESIQVIFSQVVIISPKEASTMVFPVSREEILNKWHMN